LPPCTRRRGARALRHELAEVLDTLHQLLQRAQVAGVPSTAAALESTIRITSEATEAAATRRGSAEPLIIAVREAGRVLDALAHQARTAHTLPAQERLGAALVRHPDRRVGRRLHHARQSRNGRLLHRLPTDHQEGNRLDPGRVTSHIEKVTRAHSMGRARRQTAAAHPPPTRARARARVQLGCSTP
jgi:hypothetical protein